MRREKETRDLDVHAGTASMCSPCLASLPEQDGANDGSDEPKDHVGKQDPNTILHALNPLVALCILTNEHVAKDAKRDQVAHK